MRETIEEVPRIGRILRVLARHGFVGALRRERAWPAPVHVREALEELGVVFLKFGQVLAVRRDLLSAEYAEELERLHDRLPVLPFEAVRQTIEASLGSSLAELFASFDADPLAAATIAQVHRAVLPSGRDVVVKVRRPGIEQRATEDCATLMYVAAMAERLEPRLRTVDLVGMVREFRESLQREMDLRLEGQTIRRFRAALTDSEGVWIPDVVAERTTDAVLTLEHSPGERIDQFAAAHPEMSAALAQRLAALVLHQVFETGLFQADPHPGNVFVLPDTRICLHDFGNTGELDEPMRERLARLLESTVASDTRGVVDAYLELGLVGGDVDRPSLERDVGVMLTKIHQQPLAEISVADLLQSLLRVGTKHRVRNPGVLLLLARAFLISEALMHRLDPELSVIEVFRREVERVALRRYSPARLLGEGRQLAREVERMLHEAPADLRRTLRRAADGDLGRVQTPGLEAVGRRASRDVQRLTGGVGSAALVVGGALLTTIPGWHRTVGDILLVVGMLGTLAVSVGALWRRRE